jgi:hypothetical protein
MPQHQQTCCLLSDRTLHLQEPAACGCAASRLTDQHGIKSVAVKRREATAEPAHDASKDKTLLIKSYDNSGQNAGAAACAALHLMPADVGTSLSQTPPQQPSVDRSLDGGSQQALRCRC